MNKLNVFKLTFYSWKYPSCWWRNIKMIVRAFKMAYQRITKGYCDWDCYELDDYYSNLFSATLKELALSTHSYPYDSTEEEWKEKLLRLSSQFQMIATDPDEYNPFTVNWLETSIEKDSEWQAYWGFNVTAQEKRQQLIEDTFKELAQIYNDLWD